MAKIPLFTCIIMFINMLILARQDLLSLKTKWMTHLVLAKQDSLSLKTKWMTHLGCFGVNELTDLTKVQLIRITNNQPKTCSRHCMAWNFFALLDHKCFCFDEGMFKNLMENMSNRCYRRCPDYTDNMYCGSLDKQYTNVYKREQGLPANVNEKNFDCLTVNWDKGRMSIKQMSCDQAISFICSRHNDKPVEDKLAFIMAKQYCENLQSKLMNLNMLNDSLPPNSGDNVSYWVGTFRQRIYRHESTTSGLFDITIRDNIQTKVPLTTIFIHKDKTAPGIIITNKDNIQTKVNQSKCNANQGLSEREVYVYSIGFGGLLILNIFAVSIFLCCRRYNSKQHQKKKETGQFGNLDNDKDKTMIGSSYESTNERVISDDIFQRPHSQTREENNRGPTSGSNLSSLRTLNSGYLHPYTTFTDRKETHSYCTKINFYNSSGAYSVSKLPKVASRYTHPVALLEHEHTELQTIPKSNETELHTVHYLELVDVSNNT